MPPYLVDSYKKTGVHVVKDLSVSRGNHKVIHSCFLETTTRHQSIPKRRILTHWVIKGFVSRDDCVSGTTKGLRKGQNRHVPYFSIAMYFIPHVDMSEKIKLRERVMVFFGANLHA